MDRATHCLDRADIADVEAAAYNGCIGRGVQMVAGLSGLTAAEMSSRFGFGAPVGDSVVRSGRSDAKKQDRHQAAGPLAEIHRILYKLSGGDAEIAGNLLEGITENKAKGWPGKRDPNKVTEAGTKFALSVLTKKEAEFDREVGESEGGQE